jgi:hypothetical protein
MGSHATKGTTLILSCAVPTSSLCKVEMLSNERKAIARCISKLAAHESLNHIKHWDGATHQLFSNMADNLTQEYLYKVGLKLTCLWTANRVKTMCIETVDGWNWKGSTSNLQDYARNVSPYKNQTCYAVSRAGVDRGIFCKYWY